MLFGYRAVLTAGLAAYALAALAFPDEEGGG
jgi:hypothetical protein